MAWPIPQFSRNQVNRAGEVLVDSALEMADFFWAYDVVSNWRSCHGYPINTFQATLRNKLKTIDPKAIAAQRLKRMPSIIGKLHRFDKMQLSRMQDIGGLRAVVGSLKKARELEDNYLNSRFNHELVSSKDYISSPKNSGYRCIHLIYKYENPNAPEYNGLFLELQIRTKLQHAWATAVETMGTFLDQALKASEGPEIWLDYFSLIGSAFAHLEGTEPVPGYEKLTRLQTFREANKKSRELGIRDRLQAFSIAADRIHEERGTGSYHLIILNTSEKLVTIRTYGQGNLSIASDEYANIEKQIADGAPYQVVLVSAGPIENLRRAFPNYFLDTHQFLRQLDRIERELGQRPVKRVKRNPKKRTR